jgi:transcriptional regulator with XRE-family HTH domain
MTALNLSATLTRLGISQAGLARMTGQSSITVWRWLAGDRGVPPWLASWLVMYERLTPEQRADIWHT